MGPIPKKDEDASPYLTADRSSALQESKQFHETPLRYCQNYFQKIKVYSKEPDDAPRPVARLFTWPIKVNRNVFFSLLRKKILNFEI